MTKLQRELKRGTLEMLLLHILAEEPTYGYELVSRLNRRSGGRFETKEGTLYPVLYRLEEAGMVVPDWEKPARGVPRKIYSLTAAGQEHVGELTSAWRSFSESIEAVLTGTELEEEKS